MDLVMTLTPVELDALQIAYPQMDPSDAIHALLMTVVERTSETRLQRLATLYRTLSPADQLEAARVLATWQAQKQQPLRPVDPPPGPPSDPLVDPANEDSRG